MATETPKDDEALKLENPVTDGDAEPNDAAQNTEKSEEAIAAATDSVAEEEVNDESVKQEPTSEAARSKTGVVPLLIGGVAAGAIGFAAASLLPQESQRVEEVAARVSTNEAAFNKHLAQDETRHQELADSIGGKADLTSIEALTRVVETSEENAVTQINELKSFAETALAEFDARLTELEKRPIAENGASAAAVSAYERELTALRETLEAQRTQIEAVAKDAEDRIAEAQAQAEALKSGAEAAADATLLRASLTRIEAAFESGTSFETALNDLGSAAHVEPPAALVAASASGIAPLTELQSRFPDAARAALAATAVETSDEGFLGKSLSFLKSQTGARSLTPMEGDGPDAVLSRAEASLRAGDLSGCLQEIDALPESGKTAMADWVSAANYRLEIMGAVRTLVESATVN